MNNLTEGDRERGSMFIVMSLKAQINALKIMMNSDYLVFMNITLYNEVIKKHISPQCSQYVLVALTRSGMVYTNKLLWEFLIGKREFLQNQEINAMKQKEQAESSRLKKLQKSAGQQVDERVDARVTQKMTSAVPETVQSILNETLNPNAFKNKGSKHKKKHGSRSGNKKHKSGLKQNDDVQPMPIPLAIANQSMAPQQIAMNTSAMMPTQQMVSVPSSYATVLHRDKTYNLLQSQQTNCLHLPSRTLEVVGVFKEVFLVAQSEDELGDTVAEEASLNHKVRRMLIVWMLLLLTFSKIR